ncbi:MAG: protein kinase, partial [Acidobacteriota bacterium]
MAPGLPTLGPCELLREIGRGSMGAVHLARLVEDRPYGRCGALVAVKLLNADETGEGLERLREEARLGLAVDDPSVVRTHELVEESGAAGIVLELVTGRDLQRSRAEMGELPEVLLRYVGERVARGLAALHAAGILHRDVKPGNVLLSDAHEVKLVDLGVSTLIDGLDGRARGFAGSLSFAAPEMLLEGPLGLEADQHSLGVTLYWGATGVEPFRAQSRAAMKRLHLEVEPTRVDAVNPAITPFLAEVVSTLLKRRPSERFASAAELSTILAEGEDSAWWRERRRRNRNDDKRLASPARADRTPLVGRESDLAVLASAWDTAKQARGGFVLIEATAGMGKTQLVEALAARIECEEASLLRVSHARDEDRSAWAELLATPGPGAAEGPQWELDETRQGSRALRMTRLTDRLLADEAERPVLVVVENLQLASADDLDLMLGLARLAQGHRLLVVATTRPGLPADLLATLARIEGVAHHDLPELDPRSVRDLARSLLPDVRLSSGLVDALVERSGGNPLFLQELMRGLERQGLFREETTSGRASGTAVEALGVPTSIQATVLERLDELDDDDRELLDAAAVQGPSLDAETLARMLRRPRLQVLEACTRIARETGLLSTTGSSPRFTHQVTADVLCDEQSQARLTAWHLALTELHEERYGLSHLTLDELPPESLLYLARHGLAARHVARGPELVLAAARLLEHLGQPGEVTVLCAQALEVLCPGVEASRLRCELCLLQAEALTACGDQSLQHDITAEALRVAEDLNAKELIALALMMMADTGGSLELAERALRVSREL